MTKRSIYEKFLIAFGREWESIEVIRQVLSEQRDFSFSNIFRRLNRLNKDGFITQTEIQTFLDEWAIMYTEDSLEFVAKTLDHDDDGRVSYSDLLWTILPYKMIKAYKENVIKFKGKFDLQEISKPPDEVVFEWFVDEEGNYPPEVEYYWPREEPKNGEDANSPHLITNVSTGIEFWLK